MYLTFATALALLAGVDDVEGGVGHDAFAVNAIMNGSFELVADSTTEPPKYGAFWRDAFIHEKGNPADLIVEYAPDHRGLLIARCTDQDQVPPPVSQLLTLYGPYSERFLLTLKVRFEDLDGLIEPGYRAAEDDERRLVVSVMTQGGRSIRYRICEDAEDEDPKDERVVVTLDGEPDASGFHRLRLEVGADMARLAGGPPDPWNRLSFINFGVPVLIDDVRAVHFLPRVQPRELREALLEDVCDMIAVFVGRPGTQVEGLNLVDRKSGYQTSANHHVVTGERTGDSTMGVKRGIHALLLAYLGVTDDEPTRQPLRLIARRVLKKHLKSMLTNNVNPDTGFYQLWDFRHKRPLMNAATVQQDFIQYVLTATELPYAEFRALRDDAIEAVVRIADKLAALQKQHDLGPEVKFGRGPRGNWFGRLPEKFTPDGGMDIPLKNKGIYDQAWAIKSNRSWYHDFDSAEGIARVHGVRPKPEYEACIDRLIEVYDREFDAERYDMENDTDDHYGMNVEALLRGFRTGGYRLTQMRDFAQEMTDYRLRRDAAWDDNLWVQGIRLGSFTTGDQPRAFRGPVWLSTTPAEHNPATSGFLPYERAMREQTRSDLKRRLLNDGYMTEASSKHWEMISACYLGDYIGACSENLEWEGDMGDQFAGPAANGFRALGRTLEIGRRGLNKEFLSWYYLVHMHTLDLYRRPYGYRFGLPKPTGRSYQIPERYLEGFSDTDPSMLSSTMIHAETLGSVDLDYEEAEVRIEGVKDADGLVRVALSGPPGREVEVYVAGRTEFSEVGVTDWRLRFNPVDTEDVRVMLDDEGLGVVDVARPSGGGEVAVDAILRLAGGEDVDDLASGEYRL